MLIVELLDQPLPPTCLQPAGLKRDVLYCYDLELSADFGPQPQVGGAAPYCEQAGRGGWRRGQEHVLLCLGANWAPTCDQRPLDVPPQCSF